MSSPISGFPTAAEQIHNRWVYDQATTAHYLCTSCVKCFLVWLDDESPGLTSSLTSAQQKNNFCGYVMSNHYHSSSSPDIFGINRAFSEMSRRF